MQRPDRIRLPDRSGEIARYSTTSCQVRQVEGSDSGGEKKIEEELCLGVFMAGDECQGLLALVYRTLAVPLGRSKNQGVPFILNQLYLVLSGRQLFLGIGV